MTVQQRVVDFDQGIAMVITDLHGVGPVYQHLRDHFLSLLAAGEVDRLIIAGDLIHGYGDEADDDSLDMLTDVMRLQRELGEDRVVMLLGNHEMPHIYNTTLAKGNMEFTARFEHALARLNTQPKARFRRTDVTRFLRALPFYVRTKAGVMIAHAGPAPSAKSLEVARQLLTFDHDSLLQMGEDLMHTHYPLEGIQNSPQYLEHAQHYLAVTDIDDVRYPNLLRGEIISQTRPEYALLWEALFTRNEYDASLDIYRLTVKRFLASMSSLGPYEQRVLVSGHLQVRGGYTEVCDQQLRIATYVHASPKSDGHYLLLDCGAPVAQADDLIPHLRPTLAVMQPAG